MTRWACERVCFYLWICIDRTVGRYTMKSAEPTKVLGGVRGGGRGSRYTTKKTTEETWRALSLHFFPILGAFFFLFWDCGVVAAFFRALPSFLGRLLLWLSPPLPRSSKASLFLAPFLGLAPVLMLTRDGVFAPPCSAESHSSSPPAIAYLHGNGGSIPCPHNNYNNNHSTVCLKFQDRRDLNLLNSADSNACCCSAVNL